MGEDPEKRFHSIMDKLLNAPPLKSHSNLPSPSSSSSGVLRGKKRSHLECALALVEPDKSRVRFGHVSSGEDHLCRPWDRGDLMRRLATFKSMTWFAKPKVVSAVNCARRGWINLDMDIIACEACEARLLFSTPSSWSQQQGMPCFLSFFPFASAPTQCSRICNFLLVVSEFNYLPIFSVEKAALVFSLKLDNGHKHLCPWIDNSCDERLAEFPPTSPQVLVDKFRERSCALLRLLALPLISSSAIEYMRCPQLEEFLRQSPTLEYGNGSANLSQIQFLGNNSGADSANLYYQAHKLISLCGWEPRALPYVVDCKDRSTQPVKDSDVRDSFHVVIGGQNPSIRVDSIASEQSVEAKEESGLCSEPHTDPNAIVLDCRLCGASVGLWTFSKVPQPLELFRLVGNTEVNSDKNSGQGSANENNEDIRAVIGNSPSNFALSSIHRPSDFSVTIAGGPLPTKQNFKATISLPVIGRNLRARFSYDSGFRDRICDNLEITRSGSENNNLTSEERESAEKNFGEQVCQHKAVGLLKSKTHDREQCSYASGNQSSCLNFESSESGAFSKENNSERSSEGTPITREPTFPETAGHDSAVQCSTQSPPNTVHGYDATDQPSENANYIEVLDSVVGVFGGSQVSTSSVSGSDAVVSVGNGKGSESNSEMVTSSINHDGQQIPGADISGSKNVTCQIDMRRGQTCSDIQNNIGTQEKSQEGTTDGMQVPVNSEVVAYSTGKDPKQLALDKSLGFDTIRQHRHFCPWIVSTSSEAPGWQQTLSALERQKEFSLPSANSPPSSSQIKVDDPIASVRKLFMSPIKRMKPTSG